MNKKGMSWKHIMLAIIVGITLSFISVHFLITSNKIDETIVSLRSQLKGDLVCYETQNAQMFFPELKVIEVLERRIKKWENDDLHDSINKSFINFLEEHPKNLNIRADTAFSCVLDTLPKYRFGVIGESSQEDSIAFVPNEKDIRNRYAEKMYFPILELLAKGECEIYLKKEKKKLEQLKIRNVRFGGTWYVEYLSNSDSTFFEQILTLGL